MDRNVRSICRCSCVLQFTRRRAIGSALHRPTSQVIHRSGLFNIDGRTFGGFPPNTLHVNCFARLYRFPSALIAAVLGS